MREEDFWASTLRSLINRIEGYNKHFVAKEQEEWTRARFIAFWFHAKPSVPKGAKIGMHHIVKFPWDSTPKAADELKAGREKAMAWFEEYRQKQEAEADG